MGFYSLFVTEKPCPKGGPPYPQAYNESWRLVIDSEATTKAHILQIAELLKKHARACWGVRVFGGRDLGKLIYEWTLSDGRGK